MTGLKPVDIFTAHWKGLALVYAVQGYFSSGMFRLLLSTPLRLLWRLHGYPILIAINERSPTLYWLIRLYTLPLDSFEFEYRHTWQGELRRSHDDKVVDLNIFGGGNSMSVPIAFDKEEPENNSDAETFKQLLMWYSWMQFKGGLGEMIIPRRLVRIDKVEVSIYEISLSVACRVLIRDIVLLLFAGSR